MYFLKLCILFISDYLGTKKPNHKLLHKEQTSDQSNCTDLSTIPNNEYNNSINKTTVKIENEEENYQCSVCLKQLPTLFNLEKHKLMHTNNFPLKCPYCQKKFALLKYILVHENAVIEEKYKCIICYKILCSPTSFEKHKKYHQLVHKCNECDQNFLNNRTLKEHKLTKHYSSPTQKYNVNSIKKANKKMFTCLTCGKKSKDKAMLEKHELQHTQKFKCNECLLNFKNSLLLNSHINSTHTNNYLPKDIEPTVEIKNEIHHEIIIS